MSDEQNLKIKEVQQIIEKHGLIDYIDDFFHSKKWYQSKTILFNLILAIGTGVGSLLYDDNFKTLMGDHYGLVLTLVTVGNTYLRMITSSKVTL